MTPINLETALVYIDEHGNLQDKARLLYILMQEPPPDPAVRPLLDKQNTDGGFPSRPRPRMGPDGEPEENPSSVDSTLTALWQMNELGMLGSAEALRALEYLVNSQAADGSWDENPALPGHDLPPWIQPGEIATRHYLTAYSAYWLGLSALPAGREAFRRAVDYLASQQSENGQIPGYLHGHWIGVSALLLAGADYRNAAERGIEYLAQRSFSEWEDSQLSWALDSLLSAGLEETHPFVQSGLSELAHRQEPGGSWKSEDGPAYAVSATLGALKVFRQVGWIEGV